MQKHEYLQQHHCDYLLDVWQRSLSRDPDSIFLSDSLGHDLSRKAVDELSGKVYAWLVSQNIGKEDFVMICLERGVKPFVAILGVMKCGAAFTITEGTSAPERTAYIKADCQVKIEINERNWHEIIEVESLEGFVRAEDHDAFLAIYTSGTTGKPKGILHEYGQIKMERLSENDDIFRKKVGRGGLVSPLDFVATIKFFIQVIYCSGRMYVIGFDIVKSTLRLMDYLLKNQINAVFLSPSLIRLKDPDYGPFMYYIYTGAEAANYLYIDGVTLMNTYSMSESFFTVTRFIIDKAYSVCPIGTPQLDLDIRIVDDHCNNVKEGEIGEIIFENPYCRGYINNSSQNGTKFIDGFYHTGDLGVFLNGQFILKGRRDEMIKINGNRIDPQEIMSACQKKLNLSQCAVKGFEDKCKVVLYYAENKQIDAVYAQRELSNILPQYMIPSYFVKLDKIPLTASGKVDHSALLFPNEQNRPPYAAPRNKEERKLTAAFKKVLKIDDFGIDDDFFLLGGDSIKAIQAVDQLVKCRNAVNGITAGLIYEGRTVRNICIALKRAATGLTSKEKEFTGRMQSYPLRGCAKIIYPTVKAYPNATTFNLNIAFRIRKRLFITGDRICSAFNVTKSYNSQLLTIIREDNDGNPYWAYAPENYPDIRTETMNDQEALSVADSFVQGFGSCLDKELYRIRVIESPKYVYVYIDFSHLLYDGYELSLLVQDLKSAFIGEVNKENRYYEWLYDFEEQYRSDYYIECNNYIRELYSPYVDKMRFINKGQEGNQLLINVYQLDFEPASLKKHAEDHLITNSIFINTVILCSLAIFNERRDTGIMWTFNGIEGKKNHCGKNTHVLPVALLKGKYESVTDLYTEMKNQVYEGIKRGKYFIGLEEESAIHRKNYYITIDYLANLETDAMLQKVGAEKIELSDPLVLETMWNGAVLLMQAMDTPGGMAIRLYRPTSELTEENAAAFVEIIQNVISELLKDKLPSFFAK